MGYEITICYHPPLEEGYDLSKTLTKTKRIGKAVDPVNDALLARELMREYSRRDVLVTTINVEEFVKRAVKVKPCKNGTVMVRGTKFSLEGHQLVGEGGPNCAIAEEPVVEEEEPTDLEEEPKPAARPARPAPQPVTTLASERPLRKEIFEPPLQTEHIWKAQGLVSGTSLDIYGELKLGDKTLYKIILPNGQVKNVPAELFVPESPGLAWEGPRVVEEKEPELSFGGGGARGEMPVLRR